MSSEISFKGYAGTRQVCRFGNRIFDKIIGSSLSGCFPRRAALYCTPWIRLHFVSRENRNYIPNIVPSQNYL
jgi:hypothetical protein